MSDASNSSVLTASTSATTTPSSNADFRRQLLSTPQQQQAQHQATSVKGCATPMRNTKEGSAHDGPAESGGGGTPASASTAGADSTPKPTKFADAGTKTFKLTKHGVVDPDKEDDEGGGGGEGGNDGEEGGAGGGHKKGQRVLSSRERSFIAYQAKLAVKQEAKTKYRDRAKERQKDANPDYAETSALAAQAMSEEASKYLGGDLAHTHMVKGLDYALLQKVRDELAEKERKEKEESVAVKSEVDAKPIAASSKPALAASAVPKVAVPIVDGIQFASPATASLYTSLMSTAASRSQQQLAQQQGHLFLPGRMSYSFPLAPSRPTKVGVSSLQHAQTHMNELPTRVVTSVSDLAAAQANYREENIQVALPKELWNRVIGIFQGQKEEEEERKKNKKGRSSGAASNTMSDDLHPASNAAASTSAAAAASSSSAPMDTSTNAVDETLPPLEGPSRPPRSNDDDTAADYSVPRPPAAADDDDDGDIFAGAGTDYQVKIEGDDAMRDVDDVYDVPRPPPDDDEEEGEIQGPVRPPAAASSSSSSKIAAPSTSSLFKKSSDEPAVRQLDPTAEDDSEEDDDIFAPDTSAGDEVLGITSSSASSKPLTAEQKKRKHNEEYAEAEYAGLFPEAYTRTNKTLLLLEDDYDVDDDDDASEKAKKGDGKLAKKTVINEEKQREQKFNAEFSQVSAILQARGMKIHDPSEKRRQTKQTTADDNDERAMKRAKILRGFTKTK